MARLAILKRQGSGIEFKLVDQSPTVKLSGPFYNKDTVITLERPLPIKKGEIVGLSSLTWIPMLSRTGQGDGKAAWRTKLEEEATATTRASSTASRRRRSAQSASTAASSPHRLFYKACFVPNCAQAGWPSGSWRLPQYGQSATSTPII